jgi:single-strand DNA-binding protein
MRLVTSIRGRVTPGAKSACSWEKDGQKQYRTEIVADRVQFGPRGSGGTGGGGGKAPSPEDDMASSGPGIEYPKDDINPDDIPF